MVSLFAIPGTAMADDDTDIVRGGILDFDGDLTEWIETEADTPTGSEYRLFDNWGGFWADAERTRIQGTIYCVGRPLQRT